MTLLEKLKNGFLGMVFSSNDLEEIEEAHYQNAKAGAQAIRRGQQRALEEEFDSHLLLFSDKIIDVDFEENKNQALIDQVHSLRRPGLVSFAAKNGIPFQRTDKEEEIRDKVLRHIS